MIELRNGIKGKASKDTPELVPRRYGEWITAQVHAMVDLESHTPKPRWAMLIFVLTDEDAKKRGKRG